MREIMQIVEGTKPLDKTSESGHMSVTEDATMIDETASNSEHKGFKPSKAVIKIMNRADKHREFLNTLKGRFQAQMIAEFDELTSAALKSGDWSKVASEMTKYEA